jgi:hypothetical protein
MSCQAISCTIRGHVENRQRVRKVVGVAMKIVKEIEIEGITLYKYGIGDDGKLYQFYVKPFYGEPFWSRFNCLDGGANIDDLKAMKQIVDAFWHLRAFL